MKKLFILSIALLIPIMSACSFDKSSDQESTAENVLENTSDSITQTSSQTVETTQKVTQTEALQTETTPTEAIPKAEKLNLGEIDQWNFNSRHKFIYFTDYGRYYPVEIGGRASANYALCLDRGDGEPEILTDTEDHISCYCDKNAIYIYKHGLDTAGIYKLEDNRLTVLKEVTGESRGQSMYPVYFTSDYIYYYQENKKIPTIYRMDYNGNNAETAAVLNNSYRDIYDFAVYDNKIWYEYEYKKNEDLDDYKRRGYNHRFACFDLETGETTAFENGGVGLINNNYMYFNNTYSLYRMDLSNYKCETVVTNDDDNYLSAFDFYGDYILYSSGESIYRLSDNENTLIFSVQEFFNTDYYYEIGDIQCQDDRIFITITSGPFYQSIIEIDIDGNVIEVIHEG